MENRGCETLRGLAAPPRSGLQCSAATSSGEATVDLKSKREGRSVENGGELLRDAKEVTTIEERWQVLGDGRPPKKPPKEYDYIEELARLQLELIKLQEWVRLQGLKVCVLFEGRDA